MRKIHYHHLLGKPFQHGVQDCFTLVRDFYHDNFGIELTDVARPDNWWNKGLSLYRDAIFAEGFELLPIRDPKQLRPADGMLMPIKAVEPNHAAIYVGDGKIIHHPFGQLSTIEDLDQKWQRRVTNYLRHTKVTGMEPEATKINLADDPRVKRVMEYHARRQAG